MSNYLSGAEAPFGAQIFARIQEAVLATARAQLAGRRLLEVEGPYGLGQRTLAGPDRDLGEDTRAGEAVARLKAAPVLPLPMIESTFELGVREIAAFQQGQSPFQLAPAVQAAAAAARAEDGLIFRGSEAAGLKGLANHPGTQSLQLGDWDSLGEPVEDIIKAVALLEGKGLLGPYALALAPSRFDVLFRRYQEAALLQIQHVREIITGGLVKAAALEQGGLLVAVGSYYASIVLGQDMKLGFVGPRDTAYEFVIFESLAARVQLPEAVVVLR